MPAKKKSRSRKQTPTIRIRRATLRDLPTLVAQRRAMWRDVRIRNKRLLDEADPVYARWTRSRMKNGTLVGWLAEDKGEIIGGGCVWLQPIQPMPGYNRMLQPYILSMYTNPKARGRGVASAIIDEASKWARKNKFPQVRLHAATMGRGVYSKRGFERTWEMRLKLPKSQATSHKTSPR